MHRSLQIALGGAALSFGAVVALPSVALADHCGAGQVHGGYAGGCVDVPGGGVQQPGTGQPPAEQPGTEQPGQVGGGTTSPGTGGGGTATPGVARPTTLPFTGDEILVLTLAGAGALAAGTAFAVAGRRRSAPTS